MYRQPDTLATHPTAPFVRYLSEMGFTDAVIQSQGQRMRGMLAQWPRPLQEHPVEEPHPA